MQGETLYQVFLDLTKAYDTLDCQRILLTFEACNLGSNILCNFWNALTLCPKQGGCFGHSLINSQRGVTQGGISSAILFNIVIDAIVRETKFAEPTIDHAYCANNGHLANVDSATLHCTLDLVVDLFA